MVTKIQFLCRFDNCTGNLLIVGLVQIHRAKKPSCRVGGGGGGHRDGLGASVLPPDVKHEDWSNKQEAHHQHWHRSTVTKRRQWSLPRLTRKTSSQNPISGPNLKGVGGGGSQSRCWFYWWDLETRASHISRRLWEEGVEEGTLLSSSIAIPTFPPATPLLSPQKAVIELTFQCGSLNEALRPASNAATNTHSIHTTVRRVCPPSTAAKMHSIITTAPLISHGQETGCLL